MLAKETKRNETQKDKVKFCFFRAETQRILDSLILRRQREERFRAVRQQVKWNARISEKLEQLCRSSVFT